MVAPLFASPAFAQKKTAPSKTSCGKPFERALVVSGGGVAPGLALGVIAGARDSGYKPDVIVTTCGASIGGAINNSFQDSKKAKEYLTSREFHRQLLNLAKVSKKKDFFTGEVRNLGAEELGAKLGMAHLNSGKIPDIFTGNLLDVPQDLPRMLPRQDFTRSPNEPKLVVVAARANFQPKDVGTKYGKNVLYEQTFFTDPKTAQHLHEIPASMKQNFPESPIHTTTIAKSDVSTIQAARASIADPFLIDPAKIGKDYYFAGAMDLFPVESAQTIACNVAITKPSGEYSKLEDMAVTSGFGFSQSERVKQLDRYKGLRWIDMKGASELAMDPDTDGMDLVSKVPTDYNEFKALVEKQYDFGYERARNAIEGEPAAPPSKRRPVAR
jgi:predicted acylesterase/phospholipase RssA